MTIGIAVTGAHAGLAAFRALEAVEKVARGAIGGFVSFVAIAEDGRLWRAETQRGGTATLFVDAETTGVPPPPPVAGARFAALMSSGPDRPAPLAQFTPGDAAVGLVTGHRLPNMPGEGSTIPLNEAVLARLRAGADPRTAIETELAAHPDADAGLIVVDRQGRIHAANSAFVQARGDLGQAYREDADQRHAVAVLHNAIHPIEGLAGMAAGVALDCMSPADRADFTVTLEAGMLLELDAMDALHLDAKGRVVRVTVRHPAWLAGRRDGAVVNFATPVLQEGRLVGHTTAEPYCVTEAGRLVSLSGQSQAAIGVRRSVSPRRG
jgi:hypothetical protein